MGTLGWAFLFVLASATSAQAAGESHWIAVPASFLGASLLSAEIEVLASLVRVNYTFGDIDAPISSVSPPAIWTARPPALIARIARSCCCVRLCARAGPQAEYVASEGYKNNSITGIKYFHGKTWLTARAQLAS
jgi:hypothetical protein